MTAQIVLLYGAVGKIGSQLENGLSINQLLFVGPTLQDDLFSIMTRFRVHQYVLTGDIVQMYRQILVDLADRKYQRILWRNNPNEPLESYELNRVNFGMTSVPFLAIWCILQLHLESEIIKKDFYVDDLSQVMMILIS